MTIPVFLKSYLILNVEKLKLKQFSYFKHFISIYLHILSLALVDILAGTRVKQQS